MPPTLPERAGWVDRDRLLDISGRSRSRQIELAARLGIDDYAQPAGGCCFLTDEAYSVKLADLWQSRGAREYELDDIMLLKVGRHIRPEQHYKLIVAREEGEGNFLSGYKRSYPYLRVTSHGGPLTLIDAARPLSDAELEQAARIVARYSQGKNAAEVELEFTDLDSDIRKLKVVPMPADEVRREWML